MAGQQTGIEIEVEVQYLDTHSKPGHHFHFFTYNIRISNHTRHAIQLMTRHWKIFDSGGAPREVRGPGVIGQQPVIEAGDVFQYSSACDFQGAVGRMEGVYSFRNVDTEEFFDVDVPAFVCQAEYILN